MSWMLWLRRRERLDLGLPEALASLLEMGRRALNRFDEAPPRDPWAARRDFDLNRPLG